MTKALTAIICTRNRASFLDKCIRSLLDQSCNDEVFNVLVVDNGSTDDTKSILQQYESLAHFSSVFEPVTGLSRARNRGWREAKTPLVGYIDDDAVTVKDWVTSILEVDATQTPLPAWIGGPIHLEWEVSAPAWVEGDLLVPLGYVDWGGESRYLTKTERLGGGNSVYRTDILKQIGGFDERLGRDAHSLLSGEETQLQKRLELSGERLFYHPGIKIYHYVGHERVQPRWFYRRYYWGGISDTFMAKSMDAALEELAHTEDGPEGSSGVLKRVVSNTMASTGLWGGETRRIKSRIYLSYVVGRILGHYYWLREQRSR